MRCIQVLIREDVTRDLATFDLPATDVAALQPATALDRLEATTHRSRAYAVGHPGSAGGPP